MILSHSIKVGLFSTSSSPGVLPFYPVLARRQICSMIIDTILNDRQAGTRTAEAITFSMESLGAAFTLPIENSQASIQIIRNALKIYATWITTCPSSAKPFEPQFIRDITSHISLLFDRSQYSNSASSSNIDEHVKIVNAALDVFTTLFRNRGQDLDDDTYSHCIRVYLGMCDSFLHTVEAEDIGSKVAQQMTRQMFESYIRSVNVLNPSHPSVQSLWNLLQKFSLRWCHRLTFIENWSAVCYALTKETFFLVSGNSEEFQQDPKATVDVSVDWGGRTSSIKIITTPACLKFMWNRFVHLLGNVNRLTFHGDKPTSNVTPQVHRAAIRAVYIMVEIMLKSGQSLASTSLDISATMSGRFAISAIASPPSTNTILDIYGAWLFDAALQQKEGYESGSYETRFMLVIEKAIEEEDQKALAAVLTSSKFVLGCNFKGTKVLIKSLNNAITTILEQDIDEDAQPRRWRGESSQQPNTYGGFELKLLRKACLEVLSTEICLAKPAQISSLLTAIMYTERTPTNVQKLLILMYAFMHVASASTCATLSDHILSQLADTLRANPPSGWKLPTILVAFEVLGFACDLPKHKLPIARITGSVISYCQKVLVMINNNASKTARPQGTIEGRLSSSSQSREKQLLLKSALVCLSKWVMTYPFVLNEMLPSSGAGAAASGPSMSSMASQLIKLAWEASISKILSEDTQAPAVILHQFIMRRPRNADDCLDERIAIRTALGDSIKGMTEEEIHNKSHEYAKKHVRYFLLEGRTLLTLVDGGMYWDREGGNNGHSKGDDVLVIARDATGKYCWRVNSVEDKDYDLEGIVEEGEREDSTTSTKEEDPNGASTGLPPPPPPPVNDPLAMILSLDDEDEEKSEVSSATSVVDFVDTCAEKEETASPSPSSSPNKPKPTTNSTTTRTTTTNEDNEVVEDYYELFSWHNTRRLLSQLGFLNVETWGRLEILDGTKQLVSKIVALDDTPEKDQFVVWVLRAVNQEVEGKQRIKILDYGDEPPSSAEQATLKYDTFLQELGTKIETGAHAKFMDCTNPEQIEGEFIYCESELEEVLFKVPTLPMANKTGEPLETNPALNAVGINTGDDLVNGIKKDLKNNVIVLYNDCEQQYSPDTLIWSTAYGIASAHVILIIDPLANGNYRIRVHADPSSKVFDVGAQTIGPILDGMVLNEELLPRLVRQTVISVSKAIIEFERKEGASSGKRKTLNLSGSSEPSNSGNSEKAHAFIKRQRILSRIYNEHACHIPTSQFLGMMFKGSFDHLRILGKGREWSNCSPPKVDRNVALSVLAGEGHDHGSPRVEVHKGGGGGNLEAQLQQAKRDEETTTTTNNNKKKNTGSTRTVVEEASF
ncbi:hypothetical protein TL16_g05425 [Triparma laevis f. inornata]|uniref:Rap-GAP domain-containing protein n=2 Tax=Triparma laevis TaxID=1534972 RepID=A0A9W7E9K4_9STRA|nr:hypothetical protein TL16_g05425 [Triparma laevis f. inornata]